MNQELLTTIQLGFYGLTTLFLIILLARLSRIIQILTDLGTLKEAPVAAPAAATVQSECSEEEMAAVMAVLSKMKPDQQFASVRIRLIK
jgi:hypothetical protein